jgi:hypothetical protein
MSKEEIAYEGYVKFCETLGIKPAPRNRWEHVSESAVGSYGLKDKGVKALQGYSKK